MACTEPKVSSTSSIFSAMAGSETPTSWRVAPAGLTSGPTKLKTVATPSSRRTGRGETHRRMKTRREAKADAGLVDAPPHSVRAEVDDDAERFEHVGRARERRRRTPAVLADDRPRAGDHERAERRDVDRAAPVPAGATGVDDLDADLAGSRRGRASARTRPVISSTVSPLVRRPATNAAIWAGGRGALEHVVECRGRLVGRQVLAR